MGFVVRIINRRTVVTAVRTEQRVYSITQQACDDSSPDPADRLARWVTAEFAEARGRIGTAERKLVFRLIGQITGAVRQRFFGRVGYQTTDVIPQM